MPAASTRACVVCGATSRYNCPRSSCDSSTCSLACSKSHRTIHVDAEGDGQIAAAPSEAPEVNPAIPTVHASRSQPTTYVPLASYTERHFIDDFHFLTRMGAYVSGKGKELAERRLIPAEMLSSGTHPNAANAAGRGGLNGRGGGQTGAHTRMSNEQHKKEALRKQIAYRRLGIMLLPEGMERRRLNQTALLKRDNVLVYTVSLEFPLAEATQCSSHASTPSNRRLLHRVQPSATAWSLLLAEFSKRPSEADGKSAPPMLSKRERKRRRGVNAPPSSNRPDAESSAVPAPAETFSDEVWRSIGLEPPPVIPDPQQDSQAVGGTNDAKVSARTSPYLPRDILFLVPLHNFRLRNESSQRFLEWYARQKERGLDPDAPESLEDNREGEGLNQAGSSSWGLKPLSETIHNRREWGSQATGAAGSEERAATSATSRSASGMNGIPLGLRGGDRGSGSGSRGRGRGQASGGGMPSGDGRRIGVPIGPDTSGRAHWPADLPANPTLMSESWQHQPVAAQPAAPIVQAPSYAPAPLVAPHILDMLSSLKGKAAGMRTADADKPLAAASESKTPSAVPPSDLPSEPPTVPTTDVPPPPHPIFRTHLRLPACLPIEEALKRLPEGFAVVEFPSIEVWSKKEVERRRKGAEGWIIVDPRKEGDEKLEVEGDGMALEDSEEEEEESEEEEEDDKEEEPVTAPKSGHRKIVPPARPATRPSAAAKPSASTISGLLGAYGSDDSDSGVEETGILDAYDSDSSDVGKGSNKRPKLDDVIDEAVQDARKDLITPVVEAGPEVVTGGGIAALAASLGFKAAAIAEKRAPAAISMPLPATKSPQVKGCSTVLGLGSEDEPLDWGDESLDS